MQLFLARTPRLRHPDGRTVALATLDAALLAWLAIEGATGRDRLAVLLWPDAGGEAARNNLRQRLFRLRRDHGDGLVAGRTTLALAPTVSHDLIDAGSVLGEVSCDVPGEFAQWLAAQRRSGRSRHAAALTQAADAAERSGDSAEAIVHARALVELDATSEAAHRRLMRLLYVAGDRPSALLAFDRCEAVLKDEVGTAPSAETRALLALVEGAVSMAAAGGIASSVARPGAVPAAVLRPPRLIGRHREWQQLEQAWQAGSFAVVLGEAGLGKTRLVSDFTASHGQVLAAGARPGDERVVYAAASRLLRRLPRAVLDALPATLRSELARLLPELGEATPIAGAEERTRFFNAVAAVLSADDAPFDAVAFDDLHFADDASIELLHYVAADARRPWIVAARPAEVSAPGRSLLDAFLAQPEAVRIVLAPLDANQVRELLDSLGLEAFDAAAEAPALHARTGGNPLFLLETLKLGRTAVLSRPTTGVPVSVAALIERRIGRLSERAVQLARCAAVASPDFGIELAAHVLGLRTLDLADPWAELESAQVLSDGAFAHDLIYESALASVPKPVARRLHAEVAAFLSERGGEPARIAAHWIAAGDDARALDALLAAAEAARRALRLREQAEFLHRAAEIGERIGRTNAAFHALHAWWSTMRTVDRTRIDRPFFDRLERLAGSAEERTEALLARAVWLREAGEFEASAKASEAAAAVARAEQLHMLEVKALMYSAGCASFLGDVERAVRLLRSALPWVIAEGPADAQATFFNDLGCCLDHANEPVEAETFHRRALAACHDMAAHDRAALSGANLAVNRRNVGAMGQALEALQQARRQALAIDASQGVTWPIDLHTFAVLRDLGRYADALRTGELLLQAMGQNPSMVVAGHTHIACLWIHLGQPARARQSIEAARGLQTMPFLLARLAQLEGRLLLAQGKPAEAALQAAREQAARSPRGSLGMMIELDFALTRPPDEALAAAEGVLAQAESRRLAGVALGARARAARFAVQAGQGDLAVQRAREALAAPGDIEPDDLYRGEIWLAAATAFRAGGLDGAARDAVEAGVDWLRATAAEHVPAEFRAGFLERNAVNRELLALNARIAST